MNILEMEDMVKGLPDQVLTQYAQFPDPQIPQFLALSEMQRRQDMRQRFQAQQQGMEPTVKDQILQGGIASAMPQGAPPMDQGMAPPMAPQGPMGPEMGPPQGPVMAYRGGMMPYTMSDGGMVPGGIVQMYDGRVVPNESRAARRIRLTAERNAALQAGDIETANEIERQLRIGTSAGTLSRGAAAQQAAINQPMFERMGIVPTMETPEVSMDEPSFDLTLPVSSTPAAAQGNVNAPVAAPAAEDGGIGAFNRTPPVSRGYPSIPEVVGLIQGLGADQGRPQEVTDYINLIRQQTEQGLPPPVDLGQFATRAEERGKSIREDARRQALGAALLQLGSGISTGDLAAGLRGAGEQASQIMGQGRRESGQQEALAEQLRLRGVESSREAQVQRMNLGRDAAKAIADIATSERQTQAQRELSATTLLTNFVSAMEKVAGDLDQQEQLNARSFATTATNLFESMVGPLTGFETPEQLAKRDEALVKSVTLAANMTRQDPELVLKSLREGAPVTIQYKGKSYRFPNQKAADEFKRRRQAGE